MVCKTKIAPVIMTCRDGSIRAYRPSRSFFSMAQNDFGFYFFAFLRTRAPGPGPWARALGPESDRKKSKSKIVLRRKKKVSGHPVCADRSVSASHYDRTDFRLTQNSKPHVNEQLRQKILENPGNSGTSLSI